MREYLQQDIEKAVKVLFSPANIETVIHKLEEYGQADHHREIHRVRLAILKLSQGEINKLCENIDLANIDYRDVLVAAEYKYDPQINDYTRINNPYSDMI